MNIRKANESDTDLFLETQNYPLVNFFDKKEKEILSDWFENNLESHFVIEVDGEKAGIFVVEEIPFISIAIRPEFRRKGLAFDAVLDASKFLQRKLFAFVDKENAPSEKLCEKLGFKKVQPDCYSLG